MPLMTLLIKLQVYHGASQCGGYCYTKVGWVEAGAAFELTVMCCMEKEEDPKLAG